MFFVGRVSHLSLRFFFHENENEGLVVSESVDVAGYHVPRLWRKATTIIGERGEPCNME
jgi:hypothetical protein